MGQQTSLILFIFSLFKQNSYRKIVAVSGIRTRIVGVEGKHPDNLTTTTAQTVFILMSKKTLFCLVILFLIEFVFVSFWPKQTVCFLSFLAKTNHLFLYLFGQNKLFVSCRYWPKQTVYFSIFCPKQTAGFAYFLFPSVSCPAIMGQFFECSPVSPYSIQCANVSNQFVRPIKFHQQLML